MHTQRSTISLVVVLSALLIVCASLTKGYLDASRSDRLINTTITVSGLEMDEVQP